METRRRLDDISAKTFEYGNKDEDNGSKTLNDKNHQASFQKFSQLK